MRSAWIVFVLLSVCDGLWAEKSKPTLTCSSGGDTRVIRKETQADGSCEVLYEKNGKTQSVASAKHDTDYCDASIGQIRGTLERAGFKCR